MHSPNAREHAAATGALSRAAASGTWGIPLAVATEFWCLATRLGAGNAAAMTFLRQTQAAGASIWVPEAGFWERLAGLASSMQVFGTRIFDLQIALTALDHGAHEIWTHDATFPPLPGLKVVDPL